MGVWNLIHQVLYVPQHLRITRRFWRRSLCSDTWCFDPRACCFLFVGFFSERPRVGTHAPVDTVFIRAHSLPLRSCPRYSQFAHTLHCRCIPFQSVFSYFDLCIRRTYMFVYVLLCRFTQWRVCIFYVHRMKTYPRCSGGQLKYRSYVLSVFGVYIRVNVTGEGILFSSSRPGLTPRREDLYEEI